MKNKLRTFLVIVLILFIGCTITTVFKNFTPASTNGCNITSISKTMSVTTNNKVNVSEAFFVNFSDAKSQFSYKISLTEDFNTFTDVVNMNLTDIVAVDGKVSSRVSTNIPSNGNIAMKKLAMFQMFQKPWSYLTRLNL